MTPKDSLRPIEEQFMATPDSPSTSMADLDMSEDIPDLTQPEPGVHVTLGDSATNPLTSFPLSDNETTEELQAAQDTEQAQDPKMR